MRMHGEYVLDEEAWKRAMPENLRSVPITYFGPEFHYPMAWTSWWSEHTAYFPCPSCDALVPLGGWSATWWTIGGLECYLAFSCDACGAQWATELE